MTGRGARTGVAGTARLGLRLDRRQVAIWAVCLGVVTGVVAAAFERLYPTLHDRASLRVLASNPTLRAILGGLTDWRTTGGLVAWREGTLLCVALALATTFLVVRRTRADEQHGREEVLLSLPLARGAPVEAALVVAVVLDAAAGAAVCVALLAAHQAAGPSILFGAAVGLVALSFGAIAALVAQLVGTSRGANGASAGVVAGAYLLVSLGNLAASPLLWVSPLGWFQELSPFGPSRPEVLTIPVAVTAIAGLAAVRLSERRDLGSGLLRPRAVRSRRIGASVRALAWRLERTTVVATVGSAVAYGVVVGSLVARFPSLLRASPQFAKVIERLGGTRVLTDAFTTYLAEVGAIALAAWATSLVLRARTEEQHGRTALLLSAGASRRGVLDGFVSTALAAVAAATFLWGLAIGIGRAIGEHHLSALGAGAVAGLVAIPPVLAVGGLAVACVGVTRRFALLAWVGVAWCGAVAVLGTYLGLPGWALDVSPFRHTPAIPLRGTWWVPMLVLLAIAGALVVMGRAGYARRDLGGY